MDCNNPTLAEQLPKKRSRTIDEWAIFKWLGMAHRAIRLRDEHFHNKPYSVGHMSGYMCCKNPGQLQK
jgi:hypothetical protein